MSYAVDRAKHASLVALGVNTQSVNSDRRD